MSGLSEWARVHAPEPPSDCPRCNGQREYDGEGGIECHFCGLREATE